MTRLGGNSWGKSAVRLSKVHREDGSDRFSDLTVAVQLRGEVEAAYTQGDNAGVLPTDTMRNTVYGLAQDHLDEDLEAFASLLGDHFVGREGIVGATVGITARRWDRVSSHGFTGGSTEQRTTRVETDSNTRRVRSGIEGLMVLKTTNSAFVGFPTDEYTVLPEADDRLLATTVSADWLYEPVPADTSEAWNRARETIVERFFADWSASVQHQGWLMADAVLEAVPEMAEISFRLPNQHHLSFHLDRFGLEDRGTVFQPVTEPYGDIRFTVTR